VATKVWRQKIKELGVKAKAAVEVKLVVEAGKAHK
jgi:hypothetical protein